MKFCLEIVTQRLLKAYVTLQDQKQRHDTPGCAKHSGDYEMVSVLFKEHPHEYEGLSNYLKDYNKIISRYIYVF